MLDGGSADGCTKQTAPVFLAGGGCSTDEMARTRFGVSRLIAASTDVPQPRVENRVARGTGRPAEREVATGHFPDTSCRLYS